MKFVIPSYQRSREIQLKTLKYLGEQNVPAKSIYIFVREDDPEIQKYRDLKEFNIIEANVKGIGKTHNFITDTFDEGEFIVEIDDDMVDLIDCEKNSVNFIDKCCEMKKLINEKKASYGGTYQCDNSMFMGANKEFTFDLRYCLGCLRFRFIRKEIRVETNYAEDFENCILHYLRDGLIVKNNWICPMTKNYNKGGCDGDGRDLETERWDKEFLAEKYPDYCRIFERKNKRTDLRLKDKKPKLINLLTELKFPTTTRKNIADQPYRGFVLGKVISWAGKGEKAGYRKLLSNKSTIPKYKPLYEESVNHMKSLDKDFEFTSIQYNKNCQCKKHKDKNNVGISTIIGFGNYTGGELIVYDEDGNNPVLHDIKNKPFKFNGSIYPHETAPFEGERYTLVYYAI